MALAKFTEQALGVKLNPQAQWGIPFMDKETKNALVNIIIGSIIGLGYLLLWITA